jgi:hypothetical protein
MLICGNLYSVSGKQDSEILATFGDPIQLFGGMINNDIDFVDGLKIVSGECLTIAAPADCVERVFSNQPDSHCFNERHPTKWNFCDWDNWSGIPFSAGIFIRFQDEPANK